MRIKIYFKFISAGRDILTSFLEQKMDYIHFNPVRAEIVANPEEYLYSSARDYSGEKGLVNIDFV